MSWNLVPQLTKLEGKLYHVFGCCYLLILCGMESNKNSGMNGYLGDSLYCPNTVNICLPAYAASFLPGIQNIWTNSWRRRLYLSPVAEASVHATVSLRHHQGSPSPRCRASWPQEGASERSCLPHTSQEAGSRKIKGRLGTRCSLQKHGFITGFQTLIFLCA